MTKQEILDLAKQELQSTDTIKVTVDNEKISMSTNLLNMLVANPNKNALLSESKKIYTYNVFPKEDGTYSDLDELATYRSNLGIASSISYSKYKGWIKAKGFLAGIGKDNISGKTGAVFRTYNTTDVKSILREYMAEYGFSNREVWKKEASFILYSGIIGFTATLFIIGAFILMLVMGIINDNNLLIAIAILFAVLFVVLVPVIPIYFWHRNKIVYGP